MPESEAINRFRGLERVEETDNMADLFPSAESDGPKPPETSQGEVNSEGKEVAAEEVARMWEKLSDLERKFVNCPQSQFDSIIPRYEQLHGLNKANDVRFLRMLIEKGDSRVPIIEGNTNEAAG